MGRKGEETDGTKGGYVCERLQGHFGHRNLSHLRALEVRTSNNLIPQSLNSQSYLKDVVADDCSQLSKLPNLIFKFQLQSPS